MKTVGIFLSAMMVFTVQAQVNKCVNPKTKVVTYSDTLCDTAQKSTFIEGRKSEEEIMRIQMQADEANERKYRAQQNEAQSQQSAQQRMPSQQASADKSNSYECRLAQKNHATTVSASANKPNQHLDNTNDSIKILNKACGSSIDMVVAPEKKRRPNFEPEPEQQPKNMAPTSMRCSNGICHDDANNRYFPSGDGILRGSNGTLCRSQGDRWNCN